MITGLKTENECNTVVKWNTKMDTIRVNSKENMPLQLSEVESVHWPKHPA